MKPRLFVLVSFLGILSLVFQAYAEPVNPPGRHRARAQAIAGNCHQIYSQCLQAAADLRKQCEDADKIEDEKCGKVYAEDQAECVEGLNDCMTPY